MVNTLVIKAPASVDGTYHGAIGIAATSTNNDIDRVVVLSDGTVLFNTKTYMRSNNTVALSGVALKISIAWSSVKVSQIEGGFEFAVHFMNDNKERSHLDFAIAAYPQLDNDACHGIMGECYRHCFGSLFL